ncbi:MAG TPA: DUF1559 domain-containing protein [Pirellulales bacterium]|nr:DUF1559 domain-containing protein [Pirellulales bacterium]
MKLRKFDVLSLHAGHILGNVKKQNRPAFTLVELLVVITIIGMLAALLFPAVNSAREAAHRVTCMNNQRNFALAMHEHNFFHTDDGYFPGYRQILKVTDATTGNTTDLAVVNWQVILMQHMRPDVYQAITTGAMGQSTSATPQLPYWDISVCPSDSTIQGHTSPWTSYVANTGLIDSPAPNSSGTYTVNIGGNPLPTWTPPPFPIESTANGIFQDAVLGATVTVIAGTPPSVTVVQPKVKVDFRDSRSTTLMFTENLDAHFYTAYDSTNNTIPLLTVPTTAGTVTAAQQGQWLSYLNQQQYGDCWERGAGFIWWDTSTANSANPPSYPTNTAPPYVVAGINGAKGDYDPGSLGWPANPSDALTAPVNPPTVPTVNSNYAARPSSNHPGGVVVVFADASTRFLREDIDYPTYCMLMTPDGMKATTWSHTVAGVSWQSFYPLQDGSY